eukprot:gene6811-7524_t
MLTSNLRLELEQTNALFHRWSSQQEDWLLTTTKEYQRVIEECDSTAQALVETNEQLENSRGLNDAIKLQQQSEIQQYLSHQSHLQKELHGLEMQSQALEVEEKQMEEQLSLAKEQHEMKKKKMEQALKDLTHGTKYYAMLGLDFQKAENDCMKFIFSQIDRNHPMKIFYFLIFVDERNQYQLVETNPTLDGQAVNGLMKELNTSNDIARFVLGMRQLFRHI